jgi:hypothetical protein
MKIQGKVFFKDGRYEHMFEYRLKHEVEDMRTQGRGEDR